MKKCKICGCKFVYEGRDIKHSKCRHTDYVVCPQCDYISDILFKRRYKGRGEINDGRAVK